MWIVLGVSRIVRMQQMISVIVPVYKVEKYICECVDSILAQEYKDFEIILVDDGSPDRCPEICDNYAGRSGGCNSVVTFCLLCNNRFDRKRE